MSQDHTISREASPPDTVAQPHGIQYSTVKEEEPRSEVREGSATGHSGNEQMAVAKIDGQGRTKRKKAKRACAACQRAHLTCSMSVLSPI